MTLQSKIQQPIIILCGPTCTGKTSLAIKLCQKLNGEIISADSRQIYKGMDVGTNKVQSSKFKVQNLGIRNQESGIKRFESLIHGYDLVKPDEKFSAFDFAKFGRRKIQEIQKRGKIPFIVSGTGFYIGALLGRVKISGVGADWGLREELNQKSLQELQKMLQELDPRRYQNIDKSNKVRLIRAIEIVKSSKFKVQSSKSQSKIQNLASYPTIEIGLIASRKILYQKTDQWVDDLIEQKFLDEVQKLIDQGYRSTAPMQGMIYKSGIDFLEKRLSKKEMLERIKFDMHGYIRRQLTYFRRNENIRWFDIEKESFDKSVEKFIQWKMKET